MTDRIVVIDTETGGLIESRHSLLSITITKITDRWEKQDTRTWFVKQDEYVLTPKAIQTNRIDIANAESWTPRDQIIDEMLQYLDLPADIAGGKKNDKNRWIIRGKNPEYDARFLKAFLGHDLYASMFMYWTECVYQNWYRPLVRLGVLPRLSSHKLIDLCEAMKIPVDHEQTHTSEYDVELTIMLGRKLTELEDKVKRIIKRAREARRS